MNWKIRDGQLVVFCASDSKISVRSYLWHPFPGQCKIEHIIITSDVLRWIIFIVFIHSSGSCSATHDCIRVFIVSTVHSYKCQIISMNNDHID